MKKTNNTTNTPYVNSKVGVIGMGYVGLPLALLFLKKGYQVTGIDINQSKISQLQNGKSYIPDIKDNELQDALKTDSIIFTSNYDVISQLDIIVICVPTPLTKEQIPDLSYIKNVSEEIYPRLQINQLVILESSTYPGTTRDILLPILEKSDLQIGSEFYLGYSPERIDPGNNTLKVEEIPKVVGGISEGCLQHITDFYQNVFDEIIPTSSVEIAELCKLVENSYRFINVSFINELAMLCDQLNINLWEAIDAASSKPYGFQPFYPGPGIGGHCIPIDPLYLSWIGQQHGFNNQFLALAEQKNKDISQYVINQINNIVHAEKPINEANILICGVSYKKDSNDVRTSPPLDIMKTLVKSYKSLVYFDPAVPTVEINQQTYHSTEITPQLLKKMDIVVILVDHSAIPVQDILNHAKIVYDTKNVTAGLTGSAKLFLLGNGNIS
ncbi:UDP-glucose:GDP-mannose dehydrogenase (lipopolysaccharide biosynthesis) [Oceanobacillus iheyensis HTE831]|uniref:UDP-glucose:GDP-mannose dehydrogenase (Lipopolysaccharide biosynthesis) n=1 Tax=Oceanobacillus iheyensis (strain DSM 14371 / CIP 107618 / JCM 11309 / KCTC 3954 / HTE831) TaxID=221109 RepID=Q8CXB6_OCEIH|nr:nucleotide sugar dehydrogenase [Oceanobacillus iheyensis]BAC14036.1 UDP-glucose:GDP-mannose dehydrogenase (lipopolysaccharide biosynthesis) [Oceanobacillus iheyensis HTE831]